MKTCFKTFFAFISYVIIIFNPAYALSDAEVERDLKTMEREGSKRLPMGNEHSMVISVSAGPGRKFKYHSLVSIPASQWTAEMKAHSKRIAVNDYCTNPVISAFREMGVTVIWSFSDTEGRYVTANTVSPSACQKNFR
jgi:hypothetical protein